MEILFKDDGQAAILKAATDFLGAMEILFKDDVHEKAFYHLISKCNRVDVETMSVMYLLALLVEAADENRLRCNKVYDCFDFELMCIIPSGLKKSWQHSGSAAATRLAFCLWNGFPGERSQKLNNIYNIFGYGWDKYFIEAIKIRYDR